MFTKKQLLLSMGIAAIGKAIMTTPSHAYPDNIGVQVFNSFPSFSVPSSGFVASTSDPGVLGDGGTRITGDIILGQGPTSDITIPPGMIAPDTSTPGATSAPGGGLGDTGTPGSGTTTGDGGSLGDAGIPGSDTTTGDGTTATTGEGESTTTSSGESGSGTITVNDVAEYLASNINQSVEQLDSSTIAQGPRRIVRRRSSACPNPEVSKRSAAELDALLSQSQEFIEQVNAIKPENSIW